MSHFSNFAISFSIISILAGGMTSFWLGMATSGPRVITMGWIIVGFFALLVGMAMGEICSAYPTAGGLYYWSAKLARKNHARWAWFTGYFNLIGQIGVIASVDYALSVFIGYFIRMFDDGFTLTSGNIFMIYLGVLVLHGLLNTFSVDLVKIFGDISVWWHVIGVVIIAGILFIAPSNKRGIGGAFDAAPEGLTGWTGGAFVTVYLFGVGLLLAQYTITGFDASAHVSEETKGARTEAPKAIVRSIYISAIAALVLNLAMIAAMPKKSDVDAYGAILWGGEGDAFLVNAAPRLISSAVGTGTAKFLVFIAIVGQFFCGLASVTANSRMIYAFSRDGALPGSKYWHKINKKTRTPTNSVWLGVALSAAVGTMSLYQKGGYSTAFFALTGICVIGLYICVRDPDLPASHEPRLPDRAVEPEGPAQAGRVDGVGLGQLHLDLVRGTPVLAVLADLGRRQQHLQRRRHCQRLLQGQQLQLHRATDHHRRCVRAALLEVQRQEVVHRSQGAGHQGRAAGDRARARRRGARPGRVIPTRGIAQPGQTGWAASSSQISNSGWAASRSQLASLSWA